MNNEIKEILARLSRYVITPDVRHDFDDLLDYITNLQEKVEQYEDPDDLTLFYMWLDEKAKDKMKKLQEENERLKELCDKYEEEHSTEFKIWKDERQQLLDYKSRNEKAIEYIDKELSFNVIINDKQNKVIAYNKAFANIRNILESSDEQ